MTTYNKTFLAPKKIVKEYILVLMDESLKLFLDDISLRSIGNKTNCRIELTNRILNRRVNGFRLIKYAIIKVSGFDDSAIRQCNRLLEQQFPLFRQRKEYQKRSECCTIFPEEFMPDNSSLSFQFQRTGASTYQFGDVILKSPFEPSLMRPTVTCRWRMGNSDLKKGITLAHSRQMETYLNYRFLSTIESQQPYNPKAPISHFFDDFDELSYEQSKIKKKLQKCKINLFQDYGPLKDEFISSTYFSGLASTNTVALNTTKATAATHKSINLDNNKSLISVQDLLIEKYFDNILKSVTCSILSDIFVDLGIDNEEKDSTVSKNVEPECFQPLLQTLEYEIINDAIEELFHDVINENMSIEKFKKKISSHQQDSQIEDLKRNPKDFSQIDDGKVDSKSVLQTENTIDGLKQFSQTDDGKNGPNSFTQIEDDIVDPKSLLRIEDNKSGPGSFPQIEDGIVDPKIHLQIEDDKNGRGSFSQIEDDIVDPKNILQIEDNKNGPDIFLQIEDAENGFKKNSQLEDEQNGPKSFSQYYISDSVIDRFLENEEGQEITTTLNTNSSNWLLEQVIEELCTDQKPALPKKTSVQDLKHDQDFVNAGITNMTVNEIDEAIEEETCLTLSVEKPELFERVLKEDVGNDYYMNLEETMLKPLEDNIEPSFMEQCLVDIIKGVQSDVLYSQRGHLIEAIDKLVKEETPDGSNVSQQTLEEPKMFLLEPMKNPSARLIDEIDQKVSTISSKGKINFPDGAKGHAQETKKEFQKKNLMHKLDQKILDLEHDSVPDESDKIKQIIMKGSGLNRDLTECTSTPTVEVIDSNEFDRNGNGQVGRSDIFSPQITVGSENTLNLSSTPIMEGSAVKNEESPTVTSYGGRPSSALSGTALHCEQVGVQIVDVDVDLEPQSHRLEGFSDVAAEKSVHKGRASSSRLPVVGSFCQETFPSIEHTTVSTGGLPLAVSLSNGLSFAASLHLNLPINYLVQFEFVRPDADGVSMETSIPLSVHPCPQGASFLFHLRATAESIHLADNANFTLGVCERIDRLSAPPLIGICGHRHQRGSRVTEQPTLVMFAKATPSEARAHSSGTALCTTVSLDYCDSETEDGHCEERLPLVAHIDREKIVIVMEKDRLTPTKVIRLRQLHGSAPIDRDEAPPAERHGHLSSACGESSGTLLEIKCQSGVQRTHQDFLQGPQCTVCGERSVLGYQWPACQKNCSQACTRQSGPIVKRTLLELSKKSCCQQQPQAETSQTSLQWRGHEGLASTPEASTIKAPLQSSTGSVDDLSEHSSSSGSGPTELAQPVRMRTFSDRIKVTARQILWRLQRPLVKGGILNHEPAGSYTILPGDRPNVLPGLHGSAAPACPRPPWKAPTNRQRGASPCRG